METVTDREITGLEQEKTTDIVKCPSCGANMRFSPEKQCLYCDHCESVIDFNQNQSITERDFRLRESDCDSWENETVVIRCNNCGNAQVASKTDMAKICSFCGTSNIILTDELPGIKPGAVIPFTLSGEKCIECTKKWLRGRIFAPNDCKKKADMSNIHGVYHPVWTFDSNTVSSYSGVLGRYVTRTVGSGKDRRTVTEVKYFSVSGVYNEFFDDILIEAGPAIDGATFQKLRPFNLSVAAVYDKKYLAGFTANHYDKKIDTAFKEAKSYMEDCIRSAIKRRYNADVVQSLNVNTYHNNVTFKYVLMPIWVGHFDYRQKSYNYFVNGNSGKITGKTPVSPVKVAIAVGICAIIVGGAITACVLLDESRSGANRTEHRIEKSEENSYELPGYTFTYRV